MMRLRNSVEPNQAHDCVVAGTKTARIPERNENGVLVGFHVIPTKISESYDTTQSILIDLSKIPDGVKFLRIFMDNPQPWNRDGV